MAGTNPRAVRIAGLIQRVIAQSLEVELHDPRLVNVTITDVHVTNDMQLARVFWTQLGEPGKEEGQRKRAAIALEQSKGRLRSHVGRKAGLRLTPVLEFHFDEVPGQASEIDDILVLARQRDEQLAAARAGAQYAGEADPYRHPEESDDQDWDEADDDEAGWDDQEADPAGESVGFNRSEDFVDADSAPDGPTDLGPDPDSDSDLDATDSVDSTVPAGSSDGASVLPGGSEPAEAGRRE